MEYFETRSGFNSLSFQSIGVKTKLKWGKKEKETYFFRSEMVKMGGASVGKAVQRVQVALFTLIQAAGVLFCLVTEVYINNPNRNDMFGSEFYL